MRLPKIATIQENHVHAGPARPGNVVFHTVPDVQSVAQIDFHAIRGDFEDLWMWL
jgi:hypothetical protein